MLINASAVLVLAERKIMGFMQQRYGPYLVGPHGVLQPLADILKLLFKEELRPKGADKWLFTLAPMLSVTAAFAAFATVPWGAETTFFGLLDEPVKLGVADVNVGVLVVFAVTSMGVYGIVLAGWASNSKYSLFGGLRASAQMISYELSYATALAAVILLAGSLSLREVVDAQAGTWFGFIPRWYVFLQPIGFIIYVIAGVAETNRAPFDFPEAEQELVAGYNTEYSSVRFALFPQAEYINMATMSAVATDLYLGGWHGVRSCRSWARLDLVFLAEGRRHPLRLHLDALDGSPVPLRPADAVRMEVAVPGVGDQSDRDGRAGAVLQCLRPSSSTRSRRWRSVRRRSSSGSGTRCTACCCSSPRSARCRGSTSSSTRRSSRWRRSSSTPAPSWCSSSSSSCCSTRRGGCRGVGPVAPAAAARTSGGSGRCWPRCSSCSWPGRWRSVSELEAPVGRAADAATVELGASRWAACCSPVIRFAFEATSMLILVAMVGAVVLARREGGDR